MKFQEQIGADPAVFSRAEKPENDAERSTRLRALSAAALNPFMEPKFADMPRAKRPRGEPVDVSEETPSEPVGNELAVEELDWEILPIGKGDPRGFETGAGEGRMPVEDKPENLQRLEEIAIEWGNGSYKAISQLEARDGTLYEIVILPAVIGGIAVEHALADTAKGGKSILAWRAEKGMTEEGEVVRTWREVFESTKEEAERKGARRIYHTQENTYERVRKYLRRPANQLDGRL